MRRRLCHASRWMSALLYCCTGSGIRRPHWLFCPSMPTIATIWPTISKLFCAACDARTDLRGGVIVKQHCESGAYKGQVIEHSVHGLVTIRLEGAPVRI